jgi:hypothetical protein
MCVSGSTISAAIERSSLIGRSHELRSLVIDVFILFFFLFVGVVNFYEFLLVKVLLIGLKL